MSEPFWEPFGGGAAGVQGPAGPAGPVGPAGPQGPAGSGAALPTPVEGQWLRGQSGAAVWARIPELTGTGRYGGDGTTMNVPGNDWNLAVETGFYMAANAGNAPDSNWYIGLVLSHNPAWKVQMVWQFTTEPAPKYVRAKNNGSWIGWVGW